MARNDLLIENKLLRLWIKAGQDKIGLHPDSMNSFFTLMSDDYEVRGEEVKHKLLWDDNEVFENMRLDSKVNFLFEDAKIDAPSDIVSKTETELWSSLSQT